jgi:hypothetical protein
MIKYRRILEYFKLVPNNNMFNSEQDKQITDDQPRSKFTIR